MPRHRLRANIAYAAVDSHAAWGTCGVKVWIYLGDYIKKNDKISDKISIDSTRNSYKSNNEKSKETVR